MITKSTPNIIMLLDLIENPPQPTLQSLMDEIATPPKQKKHLPLNRIRPKGTWTKQPKIKQPTNQVLSLFGCI